MRVLGIDPGTSVTGYGVIESAGVGYGLLECGVVRPTASGTFAERLLEVYEGVLAVVDRHAPDCLAVEGVFYRKNPRSAVILSHARGVALLAGARRSLPVLEYAPAEIKKSIVGTGRADKEQVAYMVQKLLSLASPPTPADAADGCAVALCHLLTGVGPVAEARIAP